MKEVRSADLSGAVAVDGRGRRSPMLLLHLTVRDLCLRAAAIIYCQQMSHRRAAEWLHQRLSRYQTGSWRRDRFAEQCPQRHRGRVEAMMWRTLRCSDRVVGEEHIRKVLARSP
jgi:hypothetical protein